MENVGEWFELRNVCVSAVVADGKCVCECSTKTHLYPSIPIEISDYSFVQLGKKKCSSSLWINVLVFQFSEYFSAHRFVRSLSIYV